MRSVSRGERSVATFVPAELVRLDDLRLAQTSRSSAIPPGPRTLVHRQSELRTYLRELAATTR